MLARGAPVNAVDEQGCTPLHIVAWRGSVPMARILVEGGADLMAKSAGGYTPFAMAQDWGTASMCQFLSELGAGRH